MKTLTKTDFKVRPYQTDADNPLPPPTNNFGSWDGRLSVINRNATKKSLASIQAAKKSSQTKKL